MILLDRILKGLLLFLVYSVLLAPARAQYIQQGPKLVGTGFPMPGQGLSVSLSGEGDTALVGAFYLRGTNSEFGSSWVFTRSGAVWNQQAQLVTAIPGSQGWSVSLSGDGNTAILGAPFDNSDVGAVLVFTRSDGVWNEGGTLVVSDRIGRPLLGRSVSLSGDGNTAIVGGPDDNYNIGAAWIFTRSQGVWSEQAKLTAADWIGEPPALGWSVSLSRDGNTAVVGGWVDNNQVGAAWVFARSAGVWSEQAKLTAADRIGESELGLSVSLSGDGNTAVIGGPRDNGSSGAAWVFTRSGGTWIEQAKLAGADAIGASTLGSSVAISGDGNTAIVGGSSDNNGLGAAWVFTRFGGTWSQPQPKLVGAGGSGQGRAVSLSSDGNYAIVGGPAGVPGGAWVYARFAGTPGRVTCIGKSVQSLALYFGGLDAAAEALGSSDVSALQSAIRGFCNG